jgi:hypothetical protein
MVVIFILGSDEIPGLQTSPRNGNMAAQQKLAVFKGIKPTRRVIPVSPPAVNPGDTEGPIDETSSLAHGSTIC